MKRALAASFVLLFLLVEGKGIRLEKGFAADDHQKNQDEKKNKLVEVEKSGANVADIATCKLDGHCSSGRNRKLLTGATSSATATTITTSKSVKSGMAKPNEAKENLSVKKLQNSSSEQKKRSHEEYPDIMDIAGMDYSTAKRKSPIHN